MTPTTQTPAAQVLPIETIELFNDSLERCTSQAGFFELFYLKFITSSDDVGSKFKHTDFSRQRRALKLSLFLLMMAAQGKPEGNTHLERIAKSHDREHMDIAPHLYDFWLASLLQTVAELDSEYNADVEKAWRDMLAYGIEFMRSRY